MKRILNRFTLGALALCAATIIVPVARAAEGDVTFPAEPSQEKASFGTDRVVLYGPVKVPAQVRNAKGDITFFFEGADMGGKVFSSELFLVDASKKRKGPLKVDVTNSFGSLAGMEGAPSHPINVFHSVNDYAVKGVRFRPRTNLKKWDQVMIAVAIREGDVKFKRIVLTTDASRYSR